MDVVSQLTPERTDLCSLTFSRCQLSLYLFFNLLVDTSILINVGLL